MKKVIPALFKTKWFKDLQKEWDKAPDIRIIARQPQDDKNAELMQKLLEHTWEENWPVVKADIETRIRTMIQKCYMVGQHNWNGYGVKGKHVCRRCGLKAGIAYDPIFAGISRVYWDSLPTIQRGRQGGTR